MRRQEREISDVSEIEAIIKSAEICRLAFSVDNTPYIVPMNHGYEDKCLYFHCAREGRKIEMLMKNPQVCFEIEGRHDLVTGEKACDWTMNFESVIGYGIATFLTDKKEKSRGLNILMKHFMGPMEDKYSDKMLDRLNVLRIDITSMTGKRIGY